MNECFRKAVIDSGPLFDALVLNYDLRRAGLGRPSRYASRIEAPQKLAWQRAFLARLASIPEKLTTSHATVELFHLEKARLNLYEPDLSYSWRTSVDLLTQWRIDEQLVRLLDLASDESLRLCLPEIGVTDTGLIELAARHGCVLITRDERTLAREAYARQVQCRLVRQLLPII